MEDRSLPSFLHPVSYPAGHNPSSVAVADFTGNGRADVVVANATYPTGTVSVLLGNGDGSFQAPVSYTVGAYPTSVAVGDFNGDGIPDLVTANVNGGTVSVLLGNGDGTFQAAHDYTAGPYPTAVAVGDFNGDGKLDLVVANAGLSANGAVSILLGNGDGTFQAPIRYADRAEPVAIAVGDFNGDGIPDVVVADNHQNRVGVFLGNGDGSFQAEVCYPVGTNPRSVAVADFNGDGKLDLVVANASYPTGTVSVLLGNGDGAFQAAMNFSTSYQSDAVAVGDFNGDGKPDLVTTKDTQIGEVNVLLGNGNGAFQAKQIYAAGIMPAAVTVGDFNGDGFPDIAVANSSDAGTVSVLLNAADWSGGSPRHAVRSTLAIAPVALPSATTPDEDAAVPGYPLASPPLGPLPRSGGGAPIAPVESVAITDRRLAFGRPLPTDRGIGTTALEDILADAAVPMSLTLREMVS